jgi:glycosyltransferase involved in cell wall biosynthesis
MFLVDWQEPFGLVLTEAMACGTPVIAYGLGSVPEVIDDGVTGYIVHTMDDAVNAVERIATLDRQLIRHVFEERFSARRMCNDYLAIYRRIRTNPSQFVGERRSPPMPDSAIAA